MKPSRWVRIFGMTMLFALPTAFLIDMLRWQHWRYAGPVLLGAIVTGAFAGEAWHRWREANS